MLRCKRCGGNVLWDGEEWACILCAERASVSPTRNMQVIKPQSTAAREVQERKEAGYDVNCGALRARAYVRARGMQPALRELALSLLEDLLIHYRSR